MTHPETLHGHGEGPAPIVPLAPVPESVGEQDDLGLRISAALIDLVLLAGLFVVMACTVGHVKTGGGSFYVSLDAAWSAAFIGLAGLYYFMLEAVFGQTVGKRLFGIQVYGPGRTRPAVWAITVRTLLRAVDILPVLYLVGFIAMMATGARRQRLGDLAARTAVARTAVARAGQVGHRALAVISLAAILLAAVGLSAYKAISPGVSLTYRAHGVSFRYPAGWQKASNYSSTSLGAVRLWGVAVGPGTQHDIIIVEGYRLLREVTAKDMTAVARDVEMSLQRTGVTTQGTPKAVTVAGLPGLRLRVTGTSRGTSYTSIVELAFNRTTEYFFNCQYTAGMAAQVIPACGQVTGSFRVTSPSARIAPGTRPTTGSGPLLSIAGLRAKILPAPSGFALSRAVGAHLGPMSAADFNRVMGTANLAAQLHFVRGYGVTYDSATNSDGIEVTLLEFATPMDAAAFKAGIGLDQSVTYRRDPAVPGATDFTSKSAHQGTYDHGVIAVKGNLAFLIDDATGVAATAPLVETMARQQYAAL
jgi:uncharacterized RDD family membrane protein YckC